MKKMKSRRENGFNCSGFIINRLCRAEVRESPRGASLATQAIANEDEVLADLDVDLVGDLGNDQDLASSTDRAGIGAPIEAHIEAPIEEEVPIEELNTKFRKSCIQDRQADKEKYAGDAFCKAGTLRLRAQQVKGTWRCGANQLVAGTGKCDPKNANGAGAHGSSSSKNLRGKPGAARVFPRPEGRPSGY